MPTSNATIIKRRDPRIVWWLFLDAIAAALALLFVAHREAIGQADGRIEGSSTPDRGTTLHVWFPVVEPGPAAKEPATAPGTALFRTDATVIVLDDDPVARASVARMARWIGCTAFTACSRAGAEHVLASHSGRVDLLIADVVLAGDCGGRAARKLLARYPALRVLYLSGEAPIPAERHAVPAGAPFLDKPCTTEQLAAAIQEALQS